MLLIGRHDFWPGYTPEVILSLEFQLWPRLALSCDAIAKQREEEREQLEQSKRSLRRR